MRKTLGLATLAGLAASAAAYAVYQSSGAALLATFGKALNDAKSVSAAYSIQMVGVGAGAVKQDFSVALKKPNLARVETASQIIVMDGKQVTTFSKGDNTYFTRPETDGDMRALLSDGQYSILLGFSDPNAYQAPTSRALGQKQMNGSAVNVVEANAAHAKTTYYLDAGNNVARTAATDYKTPSGTSASVVIHASSIDLNANLPDSTFVFNAPDGARQLSLDEINAGKWFTDLSEACKVASASHKRVFIDFMATWCGPCHMLDDECFHTDTFKKFAKSYVFCRIDVDQQPALGQQYGASAIPLQVVADAQGNPIDKTVGYGGPEAFFSFMRKNAG